MEEPVPTHLPTIRATLATALFLASATVGCAAAADGNATGCARQFDEAQRVDMESFRDFDEATWLAGHHPEAITIFASGARRQGIESIAATMHSHFVNKVAVWSWPGPIGSSTGCPTGHVPPD